MNKKTNFKGFCFSKGTKVLLSNTKTKNIEDIKIGDEILNYNVQNCVVEIEIVRKIATSMHSVVNVIEFSNGMQLESTTDHPYFVVDKGWCSVNPKASNKNYNMNVQEMYIRDKCLYFDNDKLIEVAIINIETKVKETKMYVISGGDNNSFFANGIVVSDENLLELELPKEELAKKQSIN